MRNNGRFTAAEELIALGGGDLMQLIDENCLHRNITFPGHAHASLYNTNIIEAKVRKFLESSGVEILTETRITNVEIKENKIYSITGAQKKVFHKFHMEGDMFIDATGTAGSPSNCTKYGKGCAQCVMRCKIFGSCAHLTTMSKAKEIFTMPEEHQGAMSGSCSLYKEDISPMLRERLEQDGVFVAPMPAKGMLNKTLESKVCSQYALPSFSNNLVLLNTGKVKMMTSYLSKEILRRLPGLENARYADPCFGESGNSIRYVSVAARNDAFEVHGIDNLFCCGERSGLFVGHTEALCTGTLAGYNAARKLQTKELLILPKTLAIGDLIQFIQKQTQTEEGLKKRYTFSGSVYFERMKERELYTTNIADIQKRVQKLGFKDAFKDF